MQKKMYVLVRSEFSQGYVTAQSIHAVSEFALEHTEEFNEWNNSTIVVLGVRFPRGMDRWEYILRSKGKVFSTFLEPDQEGQPTAIACYDTGELFKDLRTI